MITCPPLNVKKSLYLYIYFFMLTILNIYIYLLFIIYSIKKNKVSYNNFIYLIVIWNKKLKIKN